MLFRKLRFRRFVRTKQSEETLLNEIENKFLSKEDKSNGKKILIFHGDYSRTSMIKGTLPTPNIGFKKLLLKRFEILEVNEYNTSKLYNKTFKELTNVSVRRKKHKKYLHEILTQKEEQENRIFVNRDKNACKNILYLGKYYLTNQSRPKEFIAPLGRIRLVKAKPEERVKKEKIVKTVVSKKKKVIVV
jgi:predicted nucleotidyltransferase